MILCENCGESLEEGARFCGECGTPVADVEVTEESVNSESEPQETTPVIDGEKINQQVQETIVKVKENETVQKSVSEAKSFLSYFATKISKPNAETTNNWFGVAILGIFLLLFSATLYFVVKDYLFGQFATTNFYLEFVIQLLIFYVLIFGALFFSIRFFIGAKVEPLKLLNQFGNYHAIGSIALIISLIFFIANINVNILNLLLLFVFFISSPSAIQALLYEYAKHQEKLTIPYFYTLLINSFAICIGIYILFLENVLQIIESLPFF